MTLTGLRETQTARDGEMMRICVQFALEKPELPKDFRPVFVSFIKNCLSRYGQAYFDAYYKDRDAIMKTFTFGVRLNRPQFRGDTVFLGGNRAAFTLSTPDAKDGTILYNAMVESKFTEFPLANQNSMKIAAIRIEPTEEIRRPEIVVKMSSPLALREHCRETNADRYIDVACDAFAEKAREIVAAQLDIFQLDASLADAFSIEPVLPKKTVVVAFRSPIDVSLGVYKLTGPPALLNFLYQAGIGSRRSQGFGMFEVLA